MDATNCYTKEQLERWLDGSSEPEIELHVRDCLSCQAKIESLQAIDSLRPALFRRGDFGNPLGSDACRSVLERVKRISVGPIGETQAVATTPGAPFVGQFSFEPGQIVDHYKVIREIGRGGMSIVLEALDTRLNRHVALKFLTSMHFRALEFERIQREASTIASVHHPNVVTIHEFQSNPNGTPPYLVLELVRGPTLHDWIQSQSIRSPKLIARWIASIADGLAAAHKAEVIHRDIKPSNILLEPADDHDTWIPKLADFGLAQTEQFDAKLTQSGFLTGTPAYASPEQVSVGQITEASDIYSLGVTLFEALVGDIPFRGTPHAVIRQILEQPFPSPRVRNADVDIDLDTICLKACHHEPALRYESANAFASDLRAWLDAKPIVARPPSGMEKLQYWSRRNRRVAILLGLISSLLVVLAVGGITAALAMSHQRNLTQLEADKAIEAKNEAERSNLNAIEQKQIAESQRQLAVDSLATLINDVQVRLSARAGTLKIRQDILRTALAGLDRIVKTGDQAVLDHSRVRATAEMASIHSALGDVERANELFEEAIEQAEKLCQLEQNSPEAMCKLAESLAKHGDLANAAFAHDKSTPRYERALSLFEQAESALGTDLDIHFRRLKWSCQQKLFQRALTQNREVTIAKAELLNKELEKVWETHPDRVDLKRLLSVNYNLLANAYSGKDATKYGAAIQKGLELTGLLLEQDPQNIAIMSDLVTLQSRRARQLGEAHEYFESVEVAKAAVSSALRFAEMDRSNLSAQSLVGLVYDVLYEAELRAGNLAGASSAAQRGYESHLASGRAAPKAIRHCILAGEAAFKLADIHVRNADFDKGLQWLETSQATYSRGEELPDAASSQLPEYLKMLREYQATFRYAVAHYSEDEIGRVVATDPPTMAQCASCCYLAALTDKPTAMRNWLIRTTQMQEQAFERIEETSDKTALLKETQTVSQTLLRALGVAVRRNSLSSASSVEMRDLQETAKAVLSKPWIDRAFMIEWLKLEWDTRVIE